MRLAALFSGGKDSCLSMKYAIDEGHEVVCLITIISENPESYMFHTPNIHMTKLQAEAMQLPLIEETTKGEKEEELEDLKNAVIRAKEEFDIQGVVSGAIYSNYQRTRIDDICRELGIESLSLLWKRTPRDMLEDMVRSGFKVIMSAVAADGLGEEWLGKEFTPAVIEELCDLHNTCYVCTGGEGGEFETLVLDAPFFKKKIVIDEADTYYKLHDGALKITKAHLEKK
jgi:ABC transporter with metal-binding/Fe-S-binding domain ATP-binding protein